MEQTSAVNKRGIRGEETLMLVLFLKVVISFSHAKGFFLAGDWTSLLLICSLVLQLIAVYNFPTKKKEDRNENVFRPGVNSGLYCVLLLPLITITLTNTLTTPHPEVLMTTALSCGLLMLGPLQLQKSFTVLYLILTATPTLIIIILCFMHGGPIVPWVCGVGVGVVSAYHLPYLCLWSFTWGELSVVCQLVASSVFRMVTWLHGFFFGNEWLVVTDQMYVYFFASVVLVSVVAACALVLHWDWCDTLVPFLLVYVALGLISVGVLIFLTAHNPLLWLFWFILSSHRRVWLLAWWLVITVATAIVFALYTQRMASSESPSGKGVGGRASIEMRKAFHMVVLAVYIPGLVGDPLFLFMASLIALAVLFVLEIARLVNVQWLGTAVDLSFRVFVDDRDQGPVLLTHIYLLVGLSIPLWLSHNILSVSVSHWSGVVSLGIGDTVACVFGMKFGNTKWPGTKKTVEGTAASIIVQILFLLVIAYAGCVESIPWLWTLFAVVMSSVFEAFASQIDNLVLPLYMLAALSPTAP